MLADLAAIVALLPAAGVPVAQIPIEPAPLNVRLAWTSPDHKRFAVTWDETGDVRNKVELVRAGGTTEAAAVKYAKAGQPNRVAFDAIFPDNDWIVRVTVVDAGGDPLSKPAESPEFDTDGPPPAVLTSVVPRVDGSVRLTWMPGRYTDSNPNDPLDLPATVPPRYQPIAVDRVAGGAPVVLGPPVAGAGSFVVTGRKVPMDVGVRTVPNEWSRSQDVTAPVDGTVLSAAMPSSASTGGALTVTGLSVRRSGYCASGPCWDEDTADPGREVLLQTRTGTRGPWRTLATTKTGTDGRFSFTTASAGPGNLRVIAMPLFGTAGGTGAAYAETPVGVGPGPELRYAETPVAGDASRDDRRGGSATAIGLAVSAGALLVLAAVIPLAIRRRRRRAA